MPSLLLRTLAYLVILSSVIAIFGVLLPSKEAVSAKDAFLPLLLICSAALLFALLVLFATSAVNRSYERSPTLLSPNLTALIASVETGLALQIVPAILASSNGGSNLNWTYPFLDKRWLVAVYLISVFACLLIFPLYRRLLLCELSAALPTDSVAPVVSPTSRRKVVLLTKGLIGLLIAYVVFGPPWHINTLLTPIDYHEQVHLGPLQAIHKGSLPYIGPASIQYGPGSQLLIYLYMKMSGQFDIVSFREAHALIQYIGFSIFAALTLLYLGPVSAALVVLLSLLWSPFAMYSWDRGTLTGAYGWGNSFRYLGALILVLSLPSALSRLRRQPMYSVTAIALGFVWGVFCYVSQENLSTGILGAILLLGSSWALGFSRASAVLILCVNLGVGFSLAWLPLLAVYASHGATSRFLSNFFLVPQAVTRGYSNTWWIDGVHDPLFLIFYLAPAIVSVAATALLITTPIRPLLDTEERRRLRALACFVTFLSCYTSALCRSDASHLANVLVAFPFVLTMGIKELPLLVAERWSRRTMVAVFSLAVALGICVVPRGGLAATLRALYGRGISGPISKFQPHAVGNYLFDRNSRVPLRASDIALAETLMSCVGGPTMMELLTMVGTLEKLVGNRSVYVYSVPGLYPGIIYFLADLNPAPVLLDGITMVVNSNLRDEFVAHFAQNVDAVESIITHDLGLPEVELFVRHYPAAAAVRMKATWNGKGSNFFILLPFTVESQQSDTAVIRELGLEASRVGEWRERLARNPDA